MKLFPLGSEIDNALRSAMTEVKLMTKQTSKRLWIKL